MTFLNYKKKKKYLILSEYIYKNRVEVYKYISYKA